MFLRKAAPESLFQCFVQKLPQFTSLWKVRYNQLLPTKNPIQNPLYFVFLKNEIQHAMVHINMLLVNLIIWNLVKRSARQHITWILSTFSPFPPIPYSLIYRRAACHQGAGTILECKCPDQDWQTEILRNNHSPNSGSTFSFLTLSCSQQICHSLQIQTLENKREPLKSLRRQTHDWQGLLRVFTHRASCLQLLI